LKEKRAKAQQQIYGIWQIVLKMKILVINEISSNMKMKRLSMPNAAYLNRYLQGWKRNMSTK